MNTNETSYSTRLKVGVFSLLGLLMIGAISVMVNHRPYWWRSCQAVKINIEDATGLKTKSPIRSLGIEIGFLQTVTLSETHVTLGICVTAPVEILPNTRAYIRGEGFLGDKFVELKPVKYTGPSPFDDKGKGSDEDSHLIQQKAIEEVSQLWFQRFSNWIGIPEAYAETAPIPDPLTSPVVAKPVRKSTRGGREIPVGEEAQDIQHLVTRVDELVHQMSGLTDNLRQSLNPEDLRRVMKQLNQTLENASKTLAPEGGLNQTAQRTLAKLEDAIEQLRNIMTRISQGHGPLGTLVANEEFATQMKEAIRNLNRLLNRVGEVQFIVDVGGVNLTGISGGRGWVQVGIWPTPDHYYLLGIAGDSRGRISNSTVTTTAGGVSQTTDVQVVEKTSLLLTGMIGKVFKNRLDLSIGALYGDGAASIMLNLGPTLRENMFQFRNDIYVRNAVGSFDARTTLIVRPFDNPYFKAVYARAGFESVRGLFGATNITGGSDFFIGGGFSFSDDDIKLLFAFR